MSVYDGNGNVVDLGVQWSDIQDKDAVDSAVEQMQSMDGAFIVKPVIYDPSKIMPFNGDGEYIAYPFAPNTNFSQVTLYDENKNFVHVFDSNGNQVSHGTVGDWNTRNRDRLIFNGLSVTVQTYISWDEWNSKTPHATESFTLSGVPSFIKCGRSYNIAYTEEISNPYELRWFFVNDEQYLGFLDQTDESAHDDLIQSLTGSGDIAQRVKALSVREMNKARSAMRIGTFNIYGAGYYQFNWVALRAMLFDFALDLCAFQEVKDPLNTSGSGKDWRDFMTSWMLPYGSSNGSIYPTNERVSLSRLPIVSSSEYEFNQGGTDRRFLAKDEIQLPRYQDRVGSEQLKMSVYNTQLEVYPYGSTYESNYPNPTTATARVSEVNQILADIANDPNPFIVVCMDSNDFSPNKETWAMFEAAGFTPAIDILTQTVTAQDNCIDQIFVCPRMNVLNFNVVNSTDYEWYDIRGNGGLVPISDHDICFADIEFDYSGIFCIKQVLTGVTSDSSAVWGEMGDSLTIHLTPESGKSFTKVEIRMGANFVTKQYYSNGTLTIPEVTGDVYIIATAE